MAKDTEKLIRQLSLISFLLAVARPVSAQEIRRSVEGYATMSEDAFARRFYADRMELEALGIAVEVKGAVEGAGELETYYLRRERLHLPPIAFSKEEVVALHTALHLLDGRFAYAEPLRLALQQVTWGSNQGGEEELREGEVVLGITAAAGSREHAERLAKIEAGIVRHKTVVFDYYSLSRDELSARRVDPYHLIYQNGEFYLLGFSHERQATRIFRLSRIRGKVSFATKSEHDFQPPTDLDPRDYATKAEWQFGAVQGVATVALSERVAWYVERRFGPYGQLRKEGQKTLFSTPYADARAFLSWLLGLRGQGRLLGPSQLLAELEARLALLEERHRLGPPAARGKRPSQPQAQAEELEPGENASVIKPERFARLMALATLLIEAGRANRPLTVKELGARLGVTAQDVREDISVLNVVNFGGGMYVLYAEVGADGTVTVDPEPYSDTFERPVRLLPIEAKALLAAIDLLGSHLARGALSSAREKIVAALGFDPQGLVVDHGGDNPALAPILSAAIERANVLRLEYYKPDEDDLVVREVEPLALARGREGWYLAAYDRSRKGVRHFRLDRIKQAKRTGKRFAPRAEHKSGEDPSWLRTGRLAEARTALVWVAAERARWARERYPVVEERRDHSVVVAVAFGSIPWLVGAVLREAGDAVLLEPEEAKEELLAAVRALKESALGAVA